MKKCDESNEALKPSLEFVFSSTISGCLCWEISSLQHFAPRSKDSNQTLLKLIYYIITWRYTIEKRFNLYPAILAKLDHSIIIWYFSVIWIDTWKMLGIVDKRIYFPHLRRSQLWNFENGNFFMKIISRVTLCMLLYRYDFNYFMLFRNYHKTAKCSSTIIETQNGRNTWKEFRGELLSLLCNLIFQVSHISQASLKHLNELHDAWMIFRTFA